jgi:hypothetical protein
MKKRILISAVIVLICVLKTNSQASNISVKRTDDSLQNFMVRKSEMTISNLVKLVKYAQGGVVFETYYSILKFFKPPERKVFLSQVVELTGHFAIDDSVAELAIQQSGLSDTCSACLILKEGVDQTQLQKIAELPESELESSFKLLLTVFSIGYQEGYQKHKNAPDKLWYWDYSDAENAFKFSQMDYKQNVQLDEILRP